VRFRFTPFVCELGCFAGTFADAFDCSDAMFVVDCLDICCLVALQREKSPSSSTKGPDEGSRSILPTGRSGAKIL
jgi:hypothetical protein